MMKYILLLLLLIPIAFAEECIDGICYSCDNGELALKDGEYVCINCNQGFSLIDGVCEKDPISTSNPSLLDKFLIRYFPNNPMLGLLVLIVFVFIAGYIFLNWKTIKKNF